MLYQTVRKAVAIRLPPCGVCVIESRHAPGFTPSVIRDPFPKFLLVIGGSGRLAVGRQTFPMAPDRLFHVPAQLEYQVSDLPGRPMSLYAVCYALGIFGEKLFPSFSEPRVLLWRLDRMGPYPAEMFRADVREMLFEQEFKRPGWQTVLRSRVADLAVHAARLLDRSRSDNQVFFKKDQPAAGRVAAYALRMESHFLAGETLDQAARMASLSRRRFTELFRKVTGCTWHARLQNLRISRATRLLAETDKSVTAVAFESGFDDLSHFHRVFKKVLGCPPLEFRKTQKTKWAPPTFPKMPRRIARNAKRFAQAVVGWELAKFS